MKAVAEEIFLKDWKNIANEISEYLDFVFEKAENIIINLKQTMDFRQGYQG